MSEVTSTRAYPRYTVSLDVHVQTNQGALLAVTKDIGRGGICLVCPKQVVSGTVLELSLALALAGKSFSERLTVSGQVIWCTQAGSFYQIGVLFSKLDPEKEAQLEMFLTFLEQEVAVSSSEVELTLDEESPKNAFDLGDIDHL